MNMLQWKVESGLEAGDSKSYLTKAMIRTSKLTLSVILVIASFLFSSCDKPVKPQPVPDANQKTLTVNPVEPTFSGRTQGPFFVEIVEDHDIQPVEGVWPDVETISSLQGYRLEQDAAESVRLYPARGEAVPNADAISFWVGYRYSNRVPNHPLEYKSLVAARSPNLEIDTADAKHGQALLASAGVLGADHISEKIKIERAADGLFKLSLAGKTFEIRPGEAAVPVFVKEQQYEPGTFARALLDKLKGVPAFKEMDEEAVWDSLWDTFSPDDDVTIHTRVTARVLSSVDVSDYDVLVEMKTARQKLVEGPYEEALEALENVLLAMPDDTEVLRLWQIAQSLVESGLVASVVSGKITFPAGMPTVAQKERWKKSHEGMAALAALDAAEDEALAVTIIRDGKFRIAAPNGPYRLTVDIPGFRSYEQSLQVSGKTDVNVRVQANAA